LGSYLNLRETKLSIAANLRLLPGFERVDRYLRRKYTGSERRPYAAPGSYYSPVPDCEEIKARAAELFDANTDLGPDIRLRSDEQKKLLDELAAYYEEFDWSDKPAIGRRFYVPNIFFEIGDAIVLYAMLRRFRPKRVIEVGSGFSSALMLDTNDVFLGGEIHFTFIEPDASRLRSLLTSEDKDRVQLVEKPVQQVPAQIFSSLDVNDVLFIDSSHVAKVGSDVNYLFFKILPLLHSGVLIHVHDIMWPFEYPLEWIIEGRSWNEAYILRAFLQYNDSFDILLFNSYLGHTHRKVLTERMPRFLENTGGSLWLRKR
jgi:predicted O-methyltransferase YrrM